MRLFIAADIPDSLKASIAALQDALRLADIFRGDYVALHKLHITLLFIGNVSDNKVEDTVQLIKSINSEPLEVSLEFMQVNSYKSPAVIWIQCFSPGLTRLHATLRELFSPFLKHDEREFKPHITIARIRQPRSSLQEVHNFLAHFPLGLPEDRLTFTVSEIKLKQSQLTTTGSLYSDVYTHSLTFSEMHEAL